MLLPLLFWSRFALRLFGQWNARRYDSVRGPWFLTPRRRPQLPRFLGFPTCYLPTSCPSSRVARPARVSLGRGRRSPLLAGASLVPLSLTALLAQTPIMQAQASKGFRCLIVTSVTPPASPRGPELWMRGASRRRWLRCLDCFFFVEVSFGLFGVPPVLSVL